MGISIVDCKTTILKRSLSISQLLLLSLLTLFGCKKPPEFSNIPSIELKSAERYRVFNDDIQAFSDSVALVLRFQDGDGNLGTLQENNQVAGCDTSFNDENFIVFTYKKIEGEFIKVASSELQFGGLFPPLSAGVGPIEGDLDYHIFLPHKANEDESVLKKGDTLKFELFIVDNACNQSNIVESGEIVFREEDVQ